MKKINKPNLDSEDIFEKCVNSFKDSTFSSKCAFLSLKENIKLSHDEYDKHGTSSTLHLFKQNNLLLSYTNENEDDFEKLYNSLSLGLIMNVSNGVHFAVFIEYQK